MKLKSPFAHLSPFHELSQWWERQAVFREMGLPVSDDAPQSQLDFEEKEWSGNDEAEDQYFKQITRRARLVAQVAIVRLADTRAAAVDTTAQAAEGAREQSRSADAQPIDPQAAAVGLAALTLTPRILAQRPITARVQRGPADLI
ncbi:MAG: hypothetical protein PHO64_08660 [Thiomonas sp.]|nr:hypothetical protein [Thiomonas sp.]